MKQASINQVKLNTDGDYLIKVLNDVGGWRNQSYNGKMLSMSNPKVGTLVQLPGTIVMIVIKIGVVDFGRPAEQVDAVFLREYIAS